MEKITERLVVQSKGSLSDPEYAQQQIEVSGKQESIISYFHRNGIKTRYADVVNSCHGNTELTLDIAREMQALADQGHRVVSLQAGGLYFAKPSLEAANAPSVPVISIPLDSGYFGGLDAFLAPQIPSGIGAIAGVGVGKFDAAAYAAMQILMKEFKGVYVFNTPENLTLLQELEKWEIPIFGHAHESPKDGLIVGSLDFPSEYLPQAAVKKFSDDFEERGCLGIFTPAKIDDPKVAIALMESMQTMHKSLYVRGEANVAVFVTKMMSPYDEKMRLKLKQEAVKKVASYFTGKHGEKQPLRMTLDDFTGT